MISTFHPNYIYSQKLQCSGSLKPTANVSEKWSSVMFNAAIIKI